MASTGDELPDFVEDPLAYAQETKRMAEVVVADLPGDGRALATYESEKLPEKLIGSE